MDPNATLDDIRSAIRNIETFMVGDEDSLDGLGSYVGTLAGRFKDLDEWLLNKGYLPADWER